MFFNASTNSYFDFMISTPLERAHDTGMRMHTEQHFENNHQVLKRDREMAVGRMSHKGVTCGETQTNQRNHSSTSIPSVISAPLNLFLN